ncbi:(2Fe-2S)-binding protein [Oceanicoccus sagamiensis]|uniref:2Fe-2S ferredoxin-type domain-containing protein n=1 Tax=Oceanicoccus sagamiensis TaxID=716816 RepID=A0A1X9NJV2_9GAMM|nr:(2Fe-2S)-binding protein [Oceanicoccus sagamiensis]ARN75739.1 hypothetical protein BST96_17475 [Oceanicoccus sagamiensis]
MIKFFLNGKEVSTEVAGDMPLLWLLRDSFKLTGTKFGCGIGQCGACTVHIDGEAMRSCLMPVSTLAGRAVTTIEGLGTEEHLHPVQQAWVEQEVSQCGYCQSGQIMAASALLANKPNPGEQEIDQAMSAIICKCGSYPRIRKAIELAVKAQS